MNKVRIDPACCLMLCLWILVFPVKWLLYWLLAALLHELCHVLAVKAVGGEITDIRIGPFGAEIRARINKPWQEVLCVAAGPICGAIPVFLIRLMPELAICCMALSLYNLLPFYPLDGGRIFCLLTAENIPLRKVVDAVAVAGLLCLGIGATVHFRLGILPVIFVLCILLRHKIILAKKAP